jgi:hypothetical protein
MGVDIDHITSEDSGEWWLIAGIIHNPATEGDEVP